MGFTDSKQEMGGVITHLQVIVSYFMLNEIHVLNPKIFAMCVLGLYPPK